ncbi:Short-chain dehydrogenase [Neofusicoccum parvum]|uniref:Short-chain dehydrogenase n=2 Tax=Neofusicoccum parvum TaxID=310453 RepID=A0ACB5RSJ3_9PEZI|nr:putative short-chain dehydrogenase protein [Neofusicoccum parvum UCRNP2]GME23492.1 Short-chain dehydrogenase [Neofusicoccum parvum]GME63328.1 Short-chain dehydrogenase [Neofusicoccum parvum]
MATAGKVIIVTGASRGIGLAISHFLLQRQCRLVVIARSKEPLERLRADYPEQVQLLSGDLSDFSVGKQAADLAASAWGRLDGLVVNHGVLEPVKKIADTDPEEWRAAFDVNVFSAAALIKAALPALRSAKGRIVLVSSGAAAHSYAAWGVYGASKAVLNHMAETLAAEEPDVTTVSIRPGTVDTAMQDNIRATHHKNMDPKDAEKFLGLKPNGKLLRPDQPGNVMARLVLDAPKELNGRFLNWNDQELSVFQDA